MAISSLPPEVLSSLAITVVRQANRQTADDRTLILSICADAISFAREADATEAHVGMRARSAARLMLELAHPELGEDALRELSLACEKAVARVA